MIVLYNGTGDSMIENADDILSLVSLITILIAIIIVYLKVALLKREYKKIETEIEYYSEL